MMKINPHFLPASPGSSLGQAPPGPHKPALAKARGLKDAEGVADTTSKRPEGVRPATAAGFCSCKTGIPHILYISGSAAAVGGR